MSTPWEQPEADPLKGLRETGETSRRRYRDIPGTSDWYRADQFAWAKSQGRVVAGTSHGSSEVTHSDCSPCIQMAREAERTGMQYGGYSWSSSDGVHAAAWTPEEDA